MKLERNITIFESETVIRTRISAYLEKQGYKLVKSQPSLIYERGSSLGSFVSFSPKGWQAKIFVALSASNDQTTVAVRFDINTTGQLVIEGERRFWKTELDGLDAAIRMGKIDIGAAAETAQSTLVQNLIATIAILVLTMLLSIVTGVLFTSSGAACLGGALGLILGFIIVKLWLKF